MTNIDSVTKYDDYINYAKSLGMKAIAFSEHGSVFSWVNKKQHVEAAGMKYIHGEEFYVTDAVNALSMSGETEEAENIFKEALTLSGDEFEEFYRKNSDVLQIAMEKIRDNMHCCLYAKNYEGVIELNKLSSKSFNREDGHFYYVPRITMDELLGTSDNIIVSTACLGGILNKGKDDTKERFIEFLEKNKHRCFLEVQHHNVEDQKKYNTYLVELHEKYGIPLIAGTDTHALNHQHLDGRSIMQKAKNVRFADEELWDLTFKTYDELVYAYRVQGVLPAKYFLDAIENTNVLADMVDTFELDRSYKYPRLWEDPEKTFREKIQQGIVRRGVDKYPNYQEYLDRIEEEMEAYVHNGAIDFMLLMEDVISWCVSHDILPGYGRGSCNGSVIAYLLGITEMDSIKHKLNFSRFMNVERVSLADIDTDLEPSRIGEVKDYLFSKAGLHCCDIVTFNTIAVKGAIRDVGRALEIPLDEISDICDRIETFEDDLRKKYPELFKYVDIVKGTIVSVGSHPCGVLVSQYDVDDAIGTFTTSTDKYPISQIYMKEIDGLNYVKLDLLKLDTIELINRTCKLAGIERLTPDNMDINDVAVWNSMRDDTTCIFQWEGDTGNDYIKKLLSDKNIEKFKEIDENVDRMTLLSIGNSAIRPAGASYRDDLANGVVRKSGSAAIDEFLKSTFGYLVFQCQIIDFLHQYCGFTMGEADIVRRHFAKKTGTEDDIPIIKDGGYMNGGTHYIPGFINTMQEKYGMEREESEKTIVDFLQVIIDASRYLFSLNHSQPYSYEGYACAWLRYYYPLEFLTVALDINKDKEEKTRALTAYCKKVGIKIQRPQFRKSLANYTFDKKENTIYKGIGSIKYLNDSVADQLYAVKDKQYGSFVDLLDDIEENMKINSRQLKILIELDFFEEFGGANYLSSIRDIYKQFHGKKQLKKDKAFELKLDFDFIRKNCAKETPKMFTGINDVGIIQGIVSGLDNTETSLEDRVRYQMEYLGYIDIVDKRYKGYCVVVSVDTKYSPKLELYALANGNTIPVKIDRKIFGVNPLSKGDIVHVTNQCRKNKMRKIDNKWTKLDEKEWWLLDYFVVSEVNDGLLQ